MCTRQNNKEYSDQLKNDGGSGVILWGTQESTSPPRKRAQFSVRQRWFVGLRFLESRKPYRSTWLPLSVLTLSRVPAFFSKQIAQLRGGIHSRQSYFLSGNHLFSTPLDIVDRLKSEISVPDTYSQHKG